MNNENNEECFSAAIVTVCALRRGASSAKLPVDSLRNG